MERETYNYKGHWLDVTFWKEDGGKPTQVFPARRGDTMGSLYIPCALAAQGDKTRYLFAHDILGFSLRMPLEMRMRAWCWELMVHHTNAALGGRNVHLDSRLRSLQEVWRVPHSRDAGRLGGLSRG